MFERIDRDFTLLMGQSEGILRLGDIPAGLFETSENSYKLTITFSLNKDSWRKVKQ